MPPVDPITARGFATRRAIALANARLFRAMARRALRDGLPKAEMRAANARRAAWIVLRTAQQEARRYRPLRMILSLETESA